MCARERGGTKEKSVVIIGHVLFVAHSIYSFGRCVLA